MVVFGINFESETKGTLQTLGKQIPITAKRPEIGRAEIRTQDPDPTVFIGKEAGDVISGELRYGATILHFRMEREPRLSLILKTRILAEGEPPKGPIPQFA